jgi:dTDP-glucose 4,6-dehydratase
MVTESTHPLDNIARKGFSEKCPHNPKNPYAASKSAAEMMVMSFANTYKLPCIITRQMNIFGERQHPEKFIPLCISAAIKGVEVSVHATPDKKQAGMRHYIHARNVADAHSFLLKEQPWLSKQTFPHDVESYHIVGEIELDNLTLANTISEIVQSLDKYSCGLKPVMVDFHSSRPGHDLRYALDGSKMKGLGWVPPKTFYQSLQKTIEWSLSNRQWLVK